MLEIDARVGSERELVGAVAAFTSGFWFAGYYYASPAMLVGWEVDART